MEDKDKAPEYSTWNCTWRDPIVQPQATPQVGDLLRLTCEGQDDFVFTDAVKVVETPEEKYKLRIIEVKSSAAGSLDLVVTSYQPAEYTGKVFILSDGTHTIQTSPLNFKVESVLSTEKPPEPYPLFGPFDLSYSIWVWIILGLAALFIAIPIARKFWKSRQRKKLLAEMDIPTKQKTIEHDASKFYRTKRRELDSSNLDTNKMRGEIDRQFREYLTVRFKTPATVWSRSEILKDLRKINKKAFTAVGVSVSKLLYEIESSRKRQIDTRTAEQLLEDFRQVVEKIEKHRRDGRR